MGFNHPQEDMIDQMRGGLRHAPGVAGVDAGPPLVEDGVTSEIWADATPGAITSSRASTVDQSLAPMWAGKRLAENDRFLTSSGNSNT